MDGQKYLKGILKENALDISILENGSYLIKMIHQETDKQYVYKIIKENLLNTY